MRKLIILSVLLTSILPLGAKSTFSGQRVYLKECRLCHLGSSVYLKTHTLAEWSDILDSNGSSLANIHLSKKVMIVRRNDGSKKNSHTYFKSKYYPKSYQKLKPFIIEFAKKNNSTAN